MRLARYSVALLGAVVAGACNRPAPPAAADSTMTAAATAAPATPPGPLASSRTFTSLLGHFEYAVPDAWEQRYTASERVKPSEYPGAASLTEFLFLPMSGGTPPALLTIVAYPEATWKNLGSKPAGMVVAETNGHVLVAVPLASNPFPAGSEDATAIAPMMITAEQVKAGIKA